MPPKSKAQSLSKSERAKTNEKESQVKGKTVVANKKSKSFSKSRRIYGKK